VDVVILFLELVEDFDGSKQFPSAHEAVEFFPEAGEVFRRVGTMPCINQEVAR